MLWGIEIVRSPVLWPTTRQFIVDSVSVVSIQCLRITDRSMIMMNECQPLRRWYDTECKPRLVYQCVPPSRSPSGKDELLVIGQLKPDRALVVSHRSVKLDFPVSTGTAGWRPGHPWAAPRRRLDDDGGHSKTSHRVSAVREALGQIYKWLVTKGPNLSIVLTMWPCFWGTEIVRSPDHYLLFGRPHASL